VVDERRAQPSPVSSRCRALPQTLAAALMPAEVLAHHYKT